MSREKREKMFVYKKLFELMKQKGITRNDLRNNGIISPGSIAKLGKNERVSIDVIESLCAYLDCQPGDIMEYVSDEKIAEVSAQLDTLQSLLLQLKEQTKTQRNMSDEEIEEVTKQVMKSMDAGKISDLFKSMLQTEEQ